MFRHPNVTQARRSVEIDNTGTWVTFLDLTVNVSITDQHAIMRIMQAALDWSVSSNTIWDKLRISEAI